MFSLNKYFNSITLACDRAFYFGLNICKHTLTEMILVFSINPGTQYF